MNVKVYMDFGFIAWIEFELFDWKYKGLVRKGWNWDVKRVMLQGKVLWGRGKGALK